MKHLILAALVICMGTSMYGQASSGNALGKIVYYEGKVDVGTDPTWSAARINSEVKRGQHIRTSGDAMAEVQWTNGAKSIVGPNSKLAVDGLYASSTSTAKAETESIFTGFKSRVGSTGAAKRSEEGGIRREQVTAEQKKEKEEIYWKEDKEILFSEAYAFYENGEFARAIPALQAFLHQKPNDEMAKYAMFALGHSYIMSNNTVKAKEIFSQFVTEYPNDPLRAEAEKVIVKL